MSPARRGKVWWTLGAFVALAVLIIAYVSGSPARGQSQGREEGPVLGLSPEPQLH